MRRDLVLWCTLSVSCGGESLLSQSFVQAMACRCIRTVLQSSPWHVCSISEPHVNLNILEHSAKGCHINCFYLSAVLLKFIKVATGIQRGLLMLATPIRVLQYMSQSVLPGCGVNSLWPCFVLAPFHRAGPCSV